MAKRSFSTRQEKFLKQKQNKNSWKKPSSCLVSRHLLPPSLFFTHNMNPSYRDPFLPLFDISISYHLCMLTTILRPSSVWCGKEKNSSFWNLQKKNNKNKPKLYCSLTVCVWQHLFTFIQYKFSFPCVQMLKLITRHLTLSDISVW